jgi:hypothetical protein
MFCHEDRAKTTPFDILFEHEAACFHEAGHAVVGYLLGYGISHVEVSVNVVPDPNDPDTTGFSFGGLYKEAKRAHEASVRAIKQGNTPAALKYGIMTCAGPAAEYRYRRAAGLPMRLLLATEGVEGGAKSGHPAAMDQGSQTLILG